MLNSRFSKSNPASIVRKKRAPKQQNTTPGPFSPPRHQDLEFDASGLVQWCDGCKSQWSPRCQALWISGVCLVIPWNNPKGQYQQQFLGLILSCNGWCLWWTPISYDCIWLKGSRPIPLRIFGQIIWRFLKYIQSKPKWTLKCLCRHNVEEGQDTTNGSSHLTLF